MLLSIAHQQLKHVIFSLFWCNFFIFLFLGLRRIIFLLHSLVKVFYFMIQFRLQSFYDFNRLRYPLWQLLLHLVIAIPCVYEKDHAVIKCMTYHSSECLINRPHCPHEVPLFATYGFPFVTGPADNILKMGFLFNDERIFYVRIRNSNKNDCPAHAIWKVNALTHFTSANYGENSALAWKRLSLEIGHTQIYIFFLENDLLLLLKPLLFVGPHQLHFEIILYLERRKNQ